MKRFGISTAAGPALRHINYRRGLRYLWAVLLIPLCVWLSYRYTERRGIETIRDAAWHRADLDENSLTSELARYNYLPALVSLNPDVVALLQDPNNRPLADRVNRYLADVNRDAHSNTLYIMDLQGKTLASSNADQSYSFVGMNFAYRPYFQNALRQGSGAFYGLGTTSKEPGYFYAERIYAGRKLVGIATVKISLDKLQEVWRRAADVVMLSDANGVIFLSAYDAWQFKSLGPLSAGVRASIAATRQYDVPGALQPIGLLVQPPISDGASIATFAEQAGRPLPNLLAARYLLVSRPVAGTDWRLNTLSNIKSAEVAAGSAALGVGLGLALLTMLSLYLLQRRRIVAQELASREHLRQLNDELERKVARRTEALSRTNKTLKAEVAERRHAEAELKSTLQELVQAGKMAALGQMATSITHELNQPLAALRTLSDNALVYMQRGESDQAQGNLRVIGELTERMGKITSQLKRFARKSPSYLEPVAVAPAISNALFLLDARIRGGAVRLQREEGAGQVWVIAESNRLEQVLINLLSNALDAMAACADPVLTVAVTLEEDAVSIRVRDNGPGLTPQARQHLFEPFFTTKDQGAGLGLGLTISFSIVGEFGGTLSALDVPGGGAEFVIRLKSVVLRAADVE